MMSKRVTYEQHMALAEGKMDAAWQRYHDGWSDVCVRYDFAVALVRGTRVLDLGCGQCLLGHLLKERSPDFEIIGVDVSESELANARKLNGDDIRLVQGYAEKLIFDEGDFDTVVCAQTLEHVRDVRASAREMVRVLKRGGRLIVNVPADDKKPTGNHLHVFESLIDLTQIFGTAINWRGWGRVERYWFAWGDRR
jgi:ubiquinone/menaquinone biosynthesis C-methylase UbiE